MLSILSSNVRVTGSPIVYLPSLSGAGSVVVTLVGQTVLISGTASTGGGGGTGGGVTALNGLVGSVLISGAGTNTIITIGGQLYVSGSNVDSLNLSGALGASGSFLYGFIGTQSGFNAATYATIANLYASGSYLYQTLTGLSGVQNASIATTGQALLGDILGLSGQVNLSLGASGSYLYNLFTSGSGFNASTYATISSLFSTGSYLYGLITAQSGVANAAFVPTGTILSFLTGVPTGIDTFFVWFSGYTFASVPRVVVTWETSFSPVIYGVSVSGRTTSGFYALMTDTVLETGCYLDVLAKS